MRIAANRLLLTLVVFASLTSFPTTVQARPDAFFYIENTYYACGNNQLTYKGSETTECDGFYYSDGSLTHADGDFRHMYQENCSTGFVRDRWYYYCGGSWHLMSGAPTSPWCVC